MKKNILFISAAIIFAGCSQVPSSPLSQEELPAIFPDNIGITVPANIAPANFLIDDDADKYLTTLQSGSAQVRISGKKVSIPAKEWRQLLNNGDITVTVYEKKAGSWSRLKPFMIYVSPDQIDNFISYSEEDEQAEQQLCEGGTEVGGGVHLRGPAQDRQYAGRLRQYSSAGFRRHHPVRFDRQHLVIIIQQFQRIILIYHRLYCQGWRYALQNCHEVCQAVWLC